MYSCDHTIIIWNYRQILLKLNHTFYFQATGALDFLVGRRDFWSQQKPDYSNGPREEIGSRATWDATVNRLLNKEALKPFRAEPQLYSTNKL